MSSDYRPFSSPFASEFASWLSAEKIDYQHHAQGQFSGFSLTEKPGLAVLCLDLAAFADDTAQQEPALPATDPTHNAPHSVIHLWEDVWRTKPEIVQSRIRARIGRTVRIAARQTRVVRIDKPTADAFLQENHLYGSPAARYRYGLYLQKKYFSRLPETMYAGREGESMLVAVATFAAPRLFVQNGMAYKSGELIRFGSLLATTVTGGLSKLVDYFAARHETHDVMTYLDREWSHGASMGPSGFVPEGTTLPAHFAIDRVTYQRYPMHRIDHKILSGLAGRLIKISNAGSIKFRRHYPIPPAVADRLQPAPKIQLKAPPPYDVIFVVGPTASGKTALAVRMAYELGGEVVSLDSRQVYRGMDIGSGKDLEEYRIGNVAIPYHLIDIASPGEIYTVHQFALDFENIFRKLRDNGTPVIACGGSGLYIEAALKRLNAPEHNTPSVRIVALNPSATLRRERIEKRLLDRMKNGLIEEVRRLIREGVSETALIRYGLEYKYVTLYLQNQLGYEEMMTGLRHEINRFSKRQLTFLKKIERQGYFFSWV